MCVRVSWAGSNLVRLGGAGTGLPFVLVARRIWTGAVLERLVITLVVVVALGRL